MSCLGCQKCEMESTEMIKLQSGVIVCTECPEYQLECDAKYWIDYAMKQGKAAWIAKKNDLVKKRGLDAVNKLVEKMNELRNGRN